MAYTYVSNISPRDGFTQLELQLDNGTTAILERGRSYDLSSTEVARASRFIVLAGAGAADATPTGVIFLPVKGTPSTGQVPVWSEADGAFVPGTVAGGGGAASTWAEDPVLGWQPRPVSSQPIIWVQTTGTSDPTTLMAEHDIYVGDPPA